MKKYLFVQEGEMRRTIRGRCRVLLGLLFTVMCLMIPAKTYAAGKKNSPSVNALVLCSRDRYKGTADKFYKAVKSNTYPGYKNNTKKYRKLSKNGH